MNYLKNVSDEDLIKELEKRKEIKELSLIQPLETPDFSKLQTMIIDITDSVYKDRYQFEDSEHYIYEAAIEAVYGQSYWVWLQRVTR